MIAALSRASAGKTVYIEQILENTMEI